jgi:hypothetical protein
MIQSYIPPTTINGGHAPIDRSQNLTVSSPERMANKGKKVTAAMEVRAELGQLGWCRDHGGHVRHHCDRTISEMRGLSSRIQIG